MKIKIHKTICVGCGMMGGGDTPQKVKDLEGENKRLKAIIEGLECECEYRNGMLYRKCQGCRAKQEARGV